MFQSASSQQQPPSSTAGPLSVRPFSIEFPLQDLFHRIRTILQDLQSSPDDFKRSFQGRDLLSLLDESSAINLACPKDLFKLYHHSRSESKLTARPFVLLESNDANKQSEAKEIPQNVLLQIIELGDSLHLSESQAVCLYMQAATENLSPLRKQEELNGNINDPYSVTMGHARNLFFQEIQSISRILWVLIQYRLAAATQYTDETSTAGRSYILQATDLLLQRNLVGHLVSWIRFLTHSLESLQNQMVTNTINTTTNARFLDFYIRQRYLAVQSLFFLSYQTHLSMEEVSDMVELIRDLTQGGGSSTESLGSGLPLLDPLRHVPDPFYLATSSNPEDIVLQEKDPFLWEEELVHQLWSAEGLQKATVTTCTKLFSPAKMQQSPSTIYNSLHVPSSEAIQGSKPQLLLTVSMLILTVFTSLDDTAPKLMDRWNTPSSDPESDNGVESWKLCLKDPSLKSKLVSSGVRSRLQNFLDPSNWNRKDILGLISLAYCLQEQENPSSTTHHLTSVQTCFDFATRVKSISFARFCLLPCICSFSTLDPDSKEWPWIRSLSAFYSSALSEFTATLLSQCMDFLPMSRAKWLREKEQELQLKKVEREQKKQFRLWSGRKYADESEDDTTPLVVEFRKRPDCLDEILGLVIQLCSDCPESSYWLWDRDGDEEEKKTVSDQSYDGGRLLPGRLVRKMEKIVLEDDSLLSLFISLISVLALTPSPHANSPNGAAAVHNLLSYGIDESKFFMNWTYVVYALKVYSETFSVRTDRNSSSLSGISMDSLRRSSSSTSVTLGHESVSSMAYFDYATPKRDSMQTDSNVETTAQRIALSSIPTEESQKSSIGSIDEATKFHILSLLKLVSHVIICYPSAKMFILQMASSSDDILSILFSLAKSSVSHDVRGQTLSTLADLIRCDNWQTLSKEDQSFIFSIGRKGWDLLGDSHLIPISVVRESITTGISISSLYQSMRTDMSFKNLGVLYEIDFIERKKGIYPVTEGILKLLTSLITSAGCPVELSNTSTSSTRTSFEATKVYISPVGCSPYLSFVSMIIAPRIFAINRRHVIPFASSSNRSRLITRVLEVVHAVLTLNENKDHPLHELALIDSSIVQRQRCRLDPNVLAEIRVVLDLSSQYFVSVCHDNDDKGCIDSHASAIAIALYGDLIPSYSPIKLGRESVLRPGQTDLNIFFTITSASDGMRNSLDGIRHSMAKSLDSLPRESLLDFASYIPSPDVEKTWRDCTIYRSLYCYSTVLASRDLYFVSGFDSFLNTLKIRLSNALSTIIRFVAYRSSSLRDDFCIAESALSLVLHFSRLLSQQIFVRALRGSSSSGSEFLTRIFVSCLLFDGPDSDQKRLLQFKDKLVDILLSSTMTESPIEDNLSCIVMGLAGWSLSQQTKALDKPFAKQKLSDFSQYPTVLDAVQKQIAYSFLSDDHTMKAFSAKLLKYVYCFLTMLESDQSLSPVKLCLVTKLRLLDFWDQLPGKIAYSLETVFDHPAGLGRVCSVLTLASWGLKSLCCYHMTEQHAVAYDLRKCIHGHLNYLLDICRLQMQIVREIHRISPLKESGNEPIIMGNIPVKSVEVPSSAYSGFVTVDIPKFSELLKSLNRSDEEDLYISWADSWNLKIEVACASTHCADSCNLFLYSIVLVGCCHDVINAHDIFYLIRFLLQLIADYVEEILDSRCMSLESAIAVKILLPYSRSILWLMETLAISRKLVYDESLFDLMRHVVSTMANTGHFNECMEVLRCSLSYFLLNGFSQSQSLPEGLVLEWLSNYH